jgi:predicted porin
VNKTLLVFTAVAAACGGAVAQSTPNSITLYGIVDAGVVHTTGLRSNKNQVVSGIMEGSRFGLRGNEDLGGGWRALFVAEHRMEINTGQSSNLPPSGSQMPDRFTNVTLLSQVSGVPLNPALQPAVSLVSAGIGATLGVNLAGRFWDRQVYVGLVTPFGAILAGRQYTPAYEITATYDIMATQSSLSAGQVASFPPSVDIRVSNALQYRIVLGGLTAGAMYSMGDPAIVAGNSKANRFGGAMAMYKTGPFSVGLGYNQRNNDIGQESLKSTVLGASMAIGPGTVSGMVAKVKDDNPSGVSGIGSTPALVGAVGAAGAALLQSAFTNAAKQDGSLAHIGYKMPMGQHLLYVAYTAWNDKRAANADVASYGAAYTYSLSKRTDINAVFTHFDNKNLAQAGPGQAGYLGGVTKSAGADANSFALGVRHRF